MFFVLGLTEREIAANALIYILAGYENNSATMSYVAYCLALNPDVQERLLDEIDTKLNGKVRCRNISRVIRVNDSNRKESSM